MHFETLTKTCIANPNGQRPERKYWRRVPTSSSVTLKERSFWQPYPDQVPTTYVAATSAILTNGNLATLSTTQSVAQNLDNTETLTFERKPSTTTPRRVQNTSHHADPSYLRWVLMTQAFLLQGGANAKTNGPATRLGDVTGRCLLARTSRA